MNIRIFDARSFGNKMKHFLLVLSLVMLVLPGIQKIFGPVKESPLNGAFTLTPEDTLTKRNWFSGKYQQTFTTTINEKIGFRPTLIRIYNQFNFSLFNQSSVGTIVVGKSGYLYEENYINAYTGKDILNLKELLKKTDYIHQVQNCLERQGIHFILVFAPSKARVYPEYIPSRYMAVKKDRTNYEEYIRIIRKNYPDLHFFDVNSYFLQLKKTTSFPLYPRGGTHWSNFAVQKYFIDSLLRYMGALQHQKFPVLTQRNLHWSDHPQPPDDDIRLTLNLLFSHDRQNLPYADFSADISSVFKKPGLLVVSDSYYFMLYGNEVFNSIFKKDNFWYYNKTRYPEDFYKGKKDPFFFEDMLRHDFVILMATEINIDDMFHFPETALTWFGLGDQDIRDREMKRQERIRHYIKAIYNDPVWLNDIKGQVKKANKSLEDLIYDNADYMEQMEHQGKPE
jgi:hypothetical protein